MVNRRTGKGSKSSAFSSSSSASNRDIPPPFKVAPDSLAPFFDHLAPRHVYLVHVDNRPAAFKRKIFGVPVLMNVAVALLFVWRVWYIGPYYYLLLETALGHANAETLAARDLAWSSLAYVIFRRALTCMLDLVLAVFLWPWPVEFVWGSSSAGGGGGGGRSHGSPVAWRWAVGFRDREIYVRRSRSWYASSAASAAKTAAESSSASGSGAPPSPPNPGIDLVVDDDARRLLIAHIAHGLSPALTQHKTGYLTMDGNWDLDWAGMVLATQLVDRKDLALEAFSGLALLHHDVHGWLTVDKQLLGGGPGSLDPSTNSGDFHDGASGSGRRDANGNPYAGASSNSAADEARQRQVYAFRDALLALGKVDLFYRWIEIIQYEASRPGGFGDEAHQAQVAQRVRDEFAAQGVDFDQVWHEAVGSDGLAGM